MEAHTKFVRTAPRKIRIVLDSIRGLPLEAALDRIQFMPRQAARDVYATLKSASANAKDHGKAVSSLSINQAYCDEGPRLKRRIYGSRGRSSMISKQMSHIHIILGTTPAAKVAKKSKELTGAK